MFLEIARRAEETDRKIKEMTTSIGRLGNRLGQFREALVSQLRCGLVEEMVRPVAVRLFRERGIHAAHPYAAPQSGKCKSAVLPICDVHEVHRNIESCRDNEAIEIDLLVANDTDIIAIECKSTLSTDDVNEHMERLSKLKKLLPDYAAKRVMGAVTAMVLPDNVADYAYRRGLFVISQTGEHLTIRNDEKFMPFVW